MCYEEDAKLVLLARAVAGSTEGLTFDQLAMFVGADRCTVVVVVSPARPRAELAELSAAAAAHHVA